MTEQKTKILVIHGPNLNLLGQRESHIYGETSLKTINENVQNLGEELQVNLTFFQSNIEGEIVTTIQNALGNYAGILINPAAYTHSSIAIRDALLATQIPCIEIHLSNIYKREEFRHHSFIAPVAIGQISGFGAESYSLALRALVHFLHSQKS